MFTTIEDYKPLCDDFELEAIGANEELRLSAERTAVEVINSYCRARYDMDREFAKQGAERHPMLIQCVTVIALWIIQHRLPANMGAERRQSLYDDTMNWLHEVQLSKASPTFDTYDTDTETDTHNPVAWGSQKQTTCVW